MVKRVAQASPRLTARMAGVLYLLTFLTGAYALAFVSSGQAANLVASGCYLAVTLLFSELSQPVNRSIALLASLFSPVGCAIGALGTVPRAPIGSSSPVFFGCLCALIGHLIVRSTFLPRILGAPMALGGRGGLTFLSPSRVADLSPDNLAPGMLGEGAVPLRLPVLGVNAQRWQEQASAAGPSLRPGPPGSSPGWERQR